MKNVYIIGSYSTQFKKWPEKSFKDLVRDAYLGVLEDVGWENGDEIQFAHFGNCGMHAYGQGSIRGQVCFVPLVKEGLFPERVPMINVEGACATGSLAYYSAFRDILSGLSEVSLGLGVEKLFMPDEPEKMFSMFNGGMDALDPDQQYAFLAEGARKGGYEFQPGPGRTIFMDLYAVLANRHMAKYGTTQRQFAVSAAKCHNFGALNPKAQYRFEMTVEQVLEDREIVYPLTRSMCSPIGDGAAAAILCSEDYLKNLPSKVQNRAVRLRAVGLRGGIYRDIDLPGTTYHSAKAAFEMAGIGPEDIDVAEVHDATSVAEVLQSEWIGFCPIGEGGKFIESGATMFDGKIPINTSGGLVSKGHPIGATGLSMMYELVTQLRGEAGERQVKNPEFALMENGGGTIGFDDSVVAVTILQKDR
jgi:acetyl-CoA acetyltransferase